ncbi:hypothetical protein ACRTDR_06830 [Shewanella algae]
MAGLGSEDENVLKLLSELMGTVAELVNIFASHTHSTSPASNEAGDFSGKASAVEAQKARLYLTFPEINTNLLVRFSTLCSLHLRSLRTINIESLPGKKLPAEQKIARNWARNCPA